MDTFNTLDNTFIENLQDCTHMELHLMLPQKQIFQ